MKTWGKKLQWRLVSIYTLTMFVMLLTIQLHAQCDNPEVVTIAGTGSPGGGNGPGNVASFNALTGVTVNNAGEVFVADFLNHQIRRIDSDNFVTTFAGSGLPGSLDGIGLSAQFNSPSDVIADAAGNIFVTDFNGHRIRMITPAGVVSTIAGSGTPGLVDGNGVFAQFNNPTGIAVDDAGNLYIADSGNHAIRKISPSGQVTTIGGNGTPGYMDGSGVTLFNTPRGVSLDLAGNVVIADQNNNRIRSITPSGTASTITGDGISGLIDGPTSSARVSGPNGIIVSPEGSIIFADAGNHAIRSIMGTEVSTIAGDGTPGSQNGLGMAARFFSPKGVSLDLAGNIYVGDQGNHSVRRIGDCVVEPIEIVPTIGEWGIICLTIVLLIFNVTVFKQSQASRLQY